MHWQPEARSCTLALAVKSLLPSLWMRQTLAGLHRGLAGYRVARVFCCCILQLARDGDAAQHVQSCTEQARGDCRSWPTLHRITGVIRSGSAGPGLTSASTRYACRDGHQLTYCHMHRHANNLQTLRDCGQLACTPAAAQQRSALLPSWHLTLC